MLATYENTTNLQVLEAQQNCELLYTFWNDGVQIFSVEFDGQVYEGEVKFYESCDLFDVLVGISGTSAY